ncbi:MAG: TonB system transport protein ExbD [Xanthobacteraceae bacterium]|nr:TonB system transport protein ExbD [Xanthobacteraceae bacterium]
MAVRLGTGRRGGDVDDLGEVHDINVTPFIDVVLVLLIIFMVVAPLSTVDINVELPASTAEPAPKPDRPVTVTLQPDHTVSVGEMATQREGLAAALDAATTGRRDQRIFLRADKTVSYGELMELMNLLRDAGYLKIALVGLEAPTAAR